MNTKILEIVTNFQTVSDERKQVLKPLILYIQKKRNASQKIRLNFICTHNSRRSHLSQIWAQTMAHYFQIKDVYCYSGGTEATALFPKVSETLQNQGFYITKLSESENPVYAIKFDANESAVIGFSKKYDHKFNPVSEFCAILTCSTADEGCPYIAGAEDRIPIRFNDPKIFDETPEMDKQYLQKSLEIAQEMYFVFSAIE